MINWLRELHEFGNTKKTSVVDVFPVKIILSLLEDANQEILSLLRNEAAKLPQA